MSIELSGPSSGSGGGSGASVTTAQNPLRYVDLYNGFYGGQNAWVNGQGTTPISYTTTAAASAGSTVLSLSGVANLLTNVALILNTGTAGQQIVRVVSTSGNDVTVTPALSAPVASGSTVTSVWTDQAHPSGAAATAIARLLTYAKNADGSDVLAPANGQRVTFLGNSWFAGYSDWATQVNARYPNAVVTNVGVGGNMVSHLLARFETDVPADSKYVVFNEPGVNDVNAGLDLAVAAARMTDLVRKIQKIGAIPVYLGPPISSQHPEPSKEMARLAAAIASTEVLSPVGRVADVLTATALFNTRFGQDALGRTPSGAGNTGIGYRAGVGVTTGAQNTFVGQTSGAQNTTGGSNTGLGFDALRLNITGSFNTGVGGGALRATTGSANTAIGTSALTGSTGNFNTAIGKDAGVNSTSGSNQTFVGRAAAQSNSTPRNRVTALGDSALVNGDNATALGAGTLAGAAGAVAIGLDSSGASATTTTANEFVLGTANHRYKMPGLPTVNPGVGTGTLWNDAGTVKVA